MDYTVYQLAWLFLIYAFLGWCTEVSFVAVTLGQVVNRGFLNGPICPIYGVGMLGVLLLLGPIADNLVLLFLGGLLLSTAVELVGGWILERIFNTRWWDYSDQPFNLGGYVCLRFSIMWGLAVTFVVRLVHPLVMMLVNVVPHVVGMVGLTVLYALFATDLVMTLITIIGMKKKLGELERVADALHAVGDNISDRLGNSAMAADAKFDEMKLSGQEKMTEAKEAGQKKLVEAKEAGQKMLTENKERLEAAKESGQQKLGEGKELLSTRVAIPLQELLDRRKQLEDQQKELARDFRSHPRFGTRRLARAFPSIKKTLKEHLDGMDQE